MNSENSGKKNIIDQNYQDTPTKHQYAVPKTKEHENLIHKSPVQHNHTHIKKWKHQQNIENNLFRFKFLSEPAAIPSAR